ncbi:MAG: DUF3999 family protein [Candidatus Edwardsbacteria bacterium]|nr:DUF3999 family protein [Candidatus Edwardsbacteria bacterium]MBU1576118.1 DUF3999 family protein [Candidatus Edwardsbacteria bacterium]MBU2464020.1 DUF3999 family protein [Candidatus Edwardsbacteria bacterium]MBU2593159.1 DUF3999 family protein [Candidatus Edwardsbacteria bacterium]
MKILTATLLLCACAVCQGSVNPNDFRYRKELAVLDSLQSDVGVFRLDGDIYRGTKVDLTDIRLAGHDYREVPYLIRLATRTDTVTVRYPIGLGTIEFKEQPDNSITIILNRKETDSIPDELEIRTPAVNFEKSISVYGSDDRAAWQALAVSQPIFDYSRHIDVRNTSVTLKGPAFSYYKVVIGNAIEVKRSPFSQIVTEAGTRPGVRYESFIQNTEPFRIERAAFFGVKSEVRAANPLQVAYPLPVTFSASDTVKKATLIYCRSDRQPVNEIRLATASRIFRRQVLVEGTNDTSKTADWTTLATGIVQRLTMGAFHRENLSILLGGWQRYPRYRLRIANEDNPPIEVTEVTAMGGIHQIYFFHNQAETLTVYYGGEDVKPPRYDVAAMLADIPRVEGAQWRLGAQLTADKKGPGRYRVWLSPKNILIFSLVVMVGVLAVVLFLIVKKVEQGTDQKNE